MIKVILTAFLFVGLTFGMSSCGESKQNQQSEKEDHMHEDGEAHEHEYVCPMDCEKGKTYKEMGKCPVCKMDLVEKEHSENDGHNHHEGDGHDHNESEDHEHKEGDGHDHSEG